MANERPLPTKGRAAAVTGALRLATAAVVLLLLVPAAPATASAPVNDNFANAISIGTLPYQHAANATQATFEAGEPASCWSHPTTSLWWRYDGPKTHLRATISSRTSVEFVGVYRGHSLETLDEIGCGERDININVPQGTTVLFQVVSDAQYSGAFTFRLETRPSPSNDDFANATPIGSVPFSQSASLTNASLQPGEPGPQCPNGVYKAEDLWWKIVSPTAQDLIATLADDGDFVVAAYRGSRLSGLTQLACSWPGGYANFRAPAGVPVYLQVMSEFEDPTRDVTLSVSVQKRPKNDNFSDAAAITTLPYQGKANTTSASQEQSEPPGSCPAEWGVTQATNTVWWRYEGPSPRHLLAWLDDDAGDHFITAWDGTSLDDLMPVDCDRYGHLNVDAVRGRTLYFQVATEPWLGGRVTLHLRPQVRPPNDRFGAAISMAPLPYSATFDTTSATREPGEPTCSSRYTSTVWWRFLVPRAGYIDVSAQGSLAAYHGAKLSDVTLIKCVEPERGLAYLHLRVHQWEQLFLQVASESHSGGKGGIYVRWAGR